VPNTSPRPTRSIMRRLMRLQRRLRAPFPAEARRPRTGQVAHTLGRSARGW
jgi:hypothetical protein